MRVTSLDHYLEVREAESLAAVVLYVVRPRAALDVDHYARWNIVHISKHITYYASNYFFLPCRKHKFALVLHFLELVKIFKVQHPCKGLFKSCIDLSMRIESDD